MESTKDKIKFNKEVKKFCKYARNMLYFDYMTMNYTPKAYDIVQIVSKGLNTEDRVPSKEEETLLSNFEKEADFIGKLITAGHIVVAPTTLDIVENPKQLMTSQQLTFIVTAKEHSGKETVQLADRVIVPMEKEELDLFVEVYKRLRDVAKKGVKV